MIDDDRLFNLAARQRVFPWKKPSLISLRAAAWSHTSYLTISFYFSRAMVNSFALDDGESYGPGTLQLEPGMILSW